ncbi:MAG: hypothetical protein P0S95_05430 [Rhabdochlamydiaceae bacterium]|nr:hypothetical protein [Candidatus Amphrikana amoebophyrae]
MSKKEKKTKLSRDTDIIKKTTHLARLLKQYSEKKEKKRISLKNKVFRRDGSLEHKLEEVARFLKKNIKKI